MTVSLKGLNSNWGNRSLIQLGVTYTYTWGITVYIVIHKIACMCRFFGPLSFITNTYRFILPTRSKLHVTINKYCFFLPLTNTTIFTFDIFILLNQTKATYLYIAKHGWNNDILDPDWNMTGHGMYVNFVMCSTVLLYRTEFK